MAAIENTLTFDSSSNSYVNTHRAIDMPGVPDGSEATKLAITTTNVSIYSNDMKVGFVQSFTPSEQRDITPIQELGTEDVVQMVPGNTRGGTIQMQRVALYNSDIWNALGLTPSGKFTKKTDTNFIKDDAFTRIRRNIFALFYKKEARLLEMVSEMERPRNAVNGKIVIPKEMKEMN